MPELIVFVALLLSLYLLSKVLFKNLSIKLFMLFKSRKAVMYILAILFLPGTLIHELSHLIVAQMLFVPSGKLTLFPTLDGKLIKMGSVQIAKTDFIRHSLIGMAPFIVGTFLILGSLFLLQSKSLLSNEVILLCEGYLIFQVGNSMFSSKKDLEGTWVFFVFILAVYLGLLLLGVQVDPEHIISPQIKNLLSQSNIFLLVPIFFNLVLVALLKFI